MNFRFQSSFQRGLVLVFSFFLVAAVIQAGEKEKMIEAMKYTRPLLVTDQAIASGIAEPYLNDYYDLSTSYGKSRALGYRCYMSSVNIKRLDAALAKEREKGPRQPDPYTHETTLKAIGGKTVHQWWSEDPNKTAPIVTDAGWWWDYPNYRVSVSVGEYPPGVSNQWTDEQIARYRLQKVVKIAEALDRGMREQGLDKATFGKTESKKTTDKSSKGTPWKTVTAVGVAAAAAIGAAAAAIAKAAAANAASKAAGATANNQSSRTNKNDEKQKQTKKDDDRIVGYVLQLSDAQFTLKPGAKAQLTSTVWAVTAKGEYKLASNASISLSVPALAAGISIAPDAGQGRVTSWITWDGSDQGNSVMLEVRATAGGGDYSGSVILNLEGMELEIDTDPPNKKTLRPDERDGVWIRARVRLGPNAASADIARARDSIEFTPEGESVRWVNFGPSPRIDGEWKMVYINASKPDSVHNGAEKPPASFQITASAQVEDRPLRQTIAFDVPPDPEIDACPDFVELALKSGGRAEVKVWIDNAGEAPWKFRAAYSEKNRPVAKVDVKTVDGANATVLLTEAGLDPANLGDRNEVSVLRILAEQDGREPLERQIKISISQEGLFIDPIGRNRETGAYHIMADGSGKTTDIDFRLFLYDKESGKMVNSSELLEHLSIDSLEIAGTPIDNAISFSQLGFEYAGLRKSNEPSAIFRFKVQKEIPGDGKPLKADFKAVYKDRTEEAFTSIFSIALIPTNDGPGSNVWQVELDRCQQIVSKFVPGESRKKVQEILDKRKMTLGAEGLYELRKRLWSIAVELTLGEGGKGYENEALWADRIVTVLEWTQWAGDMAFNAVVGTFAGPYAAMGINSLKTAFISACTAYNEGKSVSDWLWENLATIPGILEGKVVDVDTFEKLGMQSRVNAWIVYVSYHFLKNLYETRSVIESAKAVVKNVGSDKLAAWLSSEVKQYGNKNLSDYARDKVTGTSGNTGETTSPTGATRTLPQSHDANAVQRVRSRMSIRNGVAYANHDDVVAIMADPALVRAIKGGPPEVREAFNNTRECIYRQHDAAVSQYIKDTVPGMKYRMVKIMEFRTPGGNSSSLNTDRDYRACYYAGRDPHTGKEQWIEIDRRQWENASYREFARLTGGNAGDPRAAREWAAQHQQLATDKYHPEASMDFSDQKKVWNPVTRKFESKQVVQTINRVKAGQPGISLEDPQGLGRMFEIKVHDAPHNQEAFVQANKAVDTLNDLRKGYGNCQQRNTGTLPPSIMKGMMAVKRANEAMAQDPNKRAPEAVAQAIRDLRANGFHDLHDFMAKMSGQFESLKLSGPPKTYGS